MIKTGPVTMPRPPLPRLVDFVRGRFVAGLLILAPFVLTYMVVRWIINVGSGVLSPLFGDWFGIHAPWLGFVVIIGAPLLLGVLALHIFGRKIVFAVEAGASRIPVIGPVFNTLEKFVSSLGPGQETGFGRVVQIVYPRPGAYAIGFMTDILEHEDGKRMGVVYIPTAPTPNSGWLAIIPIEEILDVDMNVNQVMQYTFSGGVVAPDRLVRKPIVDDLPVEPVAIPASTASRVEGDRERRRTKIKAAPGKVVRRIIRGHDADARTPGTG